MKDTLMLVVMGLFMVTPIWITAQKSYTINTSSGTIAIHEIKKVTLVGTDDNKVTIEIDGELPEVPEKAEGLKLINPQGLEDNTGIGLSVEKEGDKYIIRRVSKKVGKRYIFKVPKGLLVQYEASGWDAGLLVIENVEAELDISVSYNHVKLSGVTGPMAIHTVYGAIEADFASVSQEGPISLYSVYNPVDVTVPSSAKADFKLKVSYGDVYSDLDLTYPSNSEGMKTLSSKNLTAQSNGGGIVFTLKSGYSNIYLRKK